MNNINFNSAKFAASYGVFSQIPPASSTEIAFAGRSNVGKSSLLNKIFNRKSLARVSGVPGKTATINFYSVGNIFLADLPGYGFAKVSKSEKKRWSELIEGYLTSERNIELVVLLIDFRHPPSDDDIQMINFLIEYEYPFIIVLTKADKLKKSQRQQRMDSLAAEIPHFRDITIIPFSTVTAEGVEDLRKIISDFDD